MRPLLGFLVLTLILATGCTAKEPAPTNDDVTTAVVTDTAPVSPAVATGATPTVRTLVYELPAAEPTQTPEAKLPNVTVEPTGEPWLVDGPSWATITAESDDPRLETVAERVPDHSPTPLAIRVVAERPSRPHEHTHSGNR